MLGGAIGGFVFQRFGPAALNVGASAFALVGAVLGWVALDSPAFTRPHPIEEPVAPLPEQSPSSGAGSPRGGAPREPR
jgi:hypothetical protein